jgi:hypothetical protein
VLQELTKVPAKEDGAWWTPPNPDDDRVLKEIWERKGWNEFESGTWTPWKAMDILMEKERTAETRSRSPPSGAEDRTAKEEEAKEDDEWDSRLRTTRLMRTMFESAFASIEADTRKEEKTDSVLEEIWSRKGWNTFEGGGFPGGFQGFPKISQPSGKAAFIATNKALMRARRSTVNLSRIIRRMREENRPLDGVNIATILYCCAKKPFLLDGPILKYLVESLRGESVFFKQKEVGTALYGLQSLRDTPETRDLVAALTPKVQACRGQLQAQSLGIALYGLQSLGDSEEMRDLLPVLEDTVWDSCELDAQAVGNALYGLQSLTDSPELRGLVAALAYKVEESPAVLQAQHIGNGLYGLQGLGDSAEARSLVAALTPKVLRSQEPLLAQHVGNALYGLRRLGDTKEVRRLLLALTPKVAQCYEAFGSQEIGNALYGLQSLQTSPEARRLLAALTEKVLRCPDKLSGQAVGNALYGLQNLGDSPEM